MRVGTLTRSSGSAYVEYGNTKVVCSVQGPKQATAGYFASDRATLQVDFRFAPFSRTLPAVLDTRSFANRSSITSLSSSRGSAQESDLATQLQDALGSVLLTEKYPKTVISVHVMVLEDDGCAFSAAVTCASLALADARLEMYDLMAGASVALVSSKTGSKKATYTTLCDPTFEELNSLNVERVVSVAYMPVLRQITHIKMDTGAAWESTESSLDETSDKTEELTELSIDCAARVCEVMKKVLLSSTK